MAPHRPPPAGVSRHPIASRALAASKRRSALPGVRADSTRAGSGWLPRARLRPVAARRATRAGPVPAPAPPAPASRPGRLPPRPRARPGPAPSRLWPAPTPAPRTADSARPDRACRLPSSAAIRTAGSSAPRRPHASYKLARPLARRARLPSRRPAAFSIKAPSGSPDPAASAAGLRCRPPRPAPAACRLRPSRTADSAACRLRPPPSRPGWLSAPRLSAAGSRIRLHKGRLEETAPAAKKKKMSAAYGSSCKKKRK